MTHGPSKRRDIARSVLPSTDRKAARQKLAALKRGSRRRVRQDLRDVGRAGRRDAVVAHYDGAPFDPCRYPDAEINLAVRRRRGADKLGPLFRWAKATTRDLPVEERLAAVERLFDDNLVGRHALSHLERDEHFRPPNTPHSWWDLHVLDEPPDVMPDSRAVAADALESGRHAALNRWMKAHPTTDGNVRVLEGQHDVDAFAASVALSTQWREALLGFHRFG